MILNEESLATAFFCFVFFNFFHQTCQREFLYNRHKIILRAHTSKRERERESTTTTTTTTPQHHTTRAAILLHRKSELKTKKWEESNRARCASDLSDKIAVVTGANTGIGFHTAKLLAKANLKTVVLACRSKERAQSAKEEIEKFCKSGDNECVVEVMGLDLSDTDSINRFAKEFHKKFKRLDILVNNAGLNMSAGYSGPKVTKQGYEMCMGTNYFGHFMLTSLLLPALQKGKGRREWWRCRA